jgi:hypothetical protein
MGMLHVRGADTRAQGNRTIAEKHVGNGRYVDSRWSKRERRRRGALSEAGLETICLPRCLPA